MGVSMINGHMDPDPIFVVYDLDGCNQPPAYGVFTTLERARSAIEALTQSAVRGLFAAPVEETGLTEDDRPRIERETRESFGIQVLKNGINGLHYLEEIKD